MTTVGTSPIIGVFDQPDRASASGLPVRQRQRQNLVMERTTEERTDFNAFARPDRAVATDRPPLLLRPDFREGALWSPEFADGDEEGEAW